MPEFTSPRQARLLKCAILSPGLERRAQNAEDKAILRNYGYDIIPFVQRIDLFESIFDNTISGTVSVMENVGLSEYIPLIGVETVIVVFEVDTAAGPRRFTHAFRLVAIKDQTFPRHDWRQYTLHLVTLEFVQSMSMRVRRAFRDRHAADCVKEIVEKDLKTKLTTMEASLGKMDVVIPNYTPLMAINYFATLAQTAKKESNFLFFETLDGYHFTSISELIRKGRTADQKTLPLFKVEPGNLSTAAFVKDSEVQNAIIRIHQNQSFDVLQDIASGTLRSQLIHFDFLARKVLHTTDSRYTDTFAKTTHLDDFPLYPDNFDMSVGHDVRPFLVPSNAWSSNSAYISSRSDATPHKLHEAIVLRNRQLREIKHLQTMVELPGNPALRAGSVVIVQYPSSRTLEGVTDTTINQPVQSDGTPFYSGRHLVTSVHHILIGKGPGTVEYKMNIKVNRDSLGSPVFGTKKVS